MKNIIFQKTAAERREYMKSLFKTSLKDENVIATLIAHASLVPTIFFTPVDPVRERGHFTTWWNCIALRTDQYQNDTIHDMYLVHELYHLANKVDGFYTPFTWKMNKIQEEFEASLFSEMDIYSQIPGLRAKTFNFPILYDEIAIMGDQSAARQYRRTVTTRGAMNTSAQKLMQQYAACNQIWVDTYITIAADVEYHNIQLNNSDDFQAHIDWLDSTGDNDIPFEWLMNVFTRSCNKVKEEFK